MKLPKLTNVNAAGLAKLYNVEGKLIGRCMDTPNAIGCVLRSNLGVALVIGTFGDMFEEAEENARYHVLVEKIPGILL